MSFNLKEEALKHPNREWSGFSLLLPPVWPRQKELLITLSPLLQNTDGSHLDSSIC